ncbi:unnamed protein product [Rhizophagus irregularis]|uniref:G-protein coupled receptors family 2 profile 2 domain-containing protein n=1 Tax=Rhizophagus irregularis TaxID=588596 RepID=A0A2N1NAW5_9GLOM|nr:hypothetical protein RhiirC2_696801 [Rhizophagus irregularis]CAB4377390.1 unnamed protein product [Rhizophagus irregularis]CAB5393605.1 unnamed protein product [Rhizophagus irregularis]
MNGRLSFTSFTFFLFSIILVIFASVPVIAIDYQAKSSIIESPLSINGECPYPLVSLKSTGLSETSTSFCQNGCCLSCPIANNFYKENQIDLIFYALSVVRAISFICVLIIVVSYIVLPNKREHPAITVLCFNISLLIFTSVTFFYMGDIRKIQCADLITQATMRNNALCGVQGMVVVFSTFLLILWCFLLILHLHFQTVWGSNIVQKYHLISHIFVIALSVTFTILPSAMGKISFGFGAVCLVSPGYDNTLFWYPLAIFAIPGFLIHFCTFLFVGKSQFMSSLDYHDDSTMSQDNSNSSRLMTNVTGQEIVRAIRIQWRALMLALILLITYVIYWTYVTIEIGKIAPKNFNPPQPWILNWLNCIYENGMKSKNAQNICSSYAIDNLPKISHLAVAESGTATLGICVFIIFGTSVDLWTEWKLYFVRKFRCVTHKNSDGVTWA